MTSNALKSALGLLLICLNSVLVAQKPHLSGKVQDQDTYAPISNVNITFTGTNSGCITDRDGVFSVSPDTLPVYMIVSHIGYETRQIWLDKISGNGGINILMKPAAKMLREVEIKSIRDPEPFFKDDRYAVLDYEVDNTLVYLLVYRFRVSRAQIICKSDTGDTLAVSDLSFTPAGIFADCLGYLHVLSADSSYQVYLKKDTIIFPYKTEIRRFLSTMSDCISSTSEWLYFRKESEDRLRVDFYRINRKTKYKENITSVIDYEKMKLLMHNPLDQYFLFMDTLPSASGDIIEWVWVNKILYKPNTSVLQKAGDSILIFNTTDGMLEIYDRDGKYISKAAMPVLQKGGEKWTKEIYFDELTHIPYTTFMKNGRLHIYSINPTNGELKSELMTNHIFPEKIRINNNFLFYLYDIPGTGDNKHLFRQRINF